MRKKGNRDAGKIPEGTPYSPAMAFSAGVFKITCGRFFLLGHAEKLGVTVAWNRERLKAGDHPFPDLQGGYDLDDDFQVIVVREVPRKDDDTDADHRDRLLFNLAMVLNPLLGTPGCVNDAPVVLGYDRSAAMKARWRDPKFAESRLTMLKSQAARGPSKRTREKMARSKTGGKNPRARKVLLEEAGIDYEFGSAAEAARHFGVPQQVMDGWLRGICPWPGTGRRASRYPQLNGLTGRYC